METYARDPAARHAPDQPSPFIVKVQTELTEIRQRLGTFTDRLHGAGFYGPPEIAQSETKPSENTPRSYIVDDFEVIRSQLETLDHQLSRVVG